MKWKKLGLIFAPNHETTKMINYARIPIADHIGNGTFDIYFGSRDLTNRERIFKIKYDLNTLQIKHVKTTPILVFGENLCAFDDNGVSPCCILSLENRKILYYCGWNIHVNIPFTCAIGMAESIDGGNTFIKKFEGAVLDRDRFDPQFVAVNDVIIDEGKYRTWYLSCKKWVKNDNHIKHYYNIKHAISVNGIDWEKNYDTAIDFKNEFEYAISTPRIIKDGNKDYKMWYSYRGQKDSDKYRIGYAESKNGINWIRMDEKMQSLNLSSSGWDSEMVCYPFVFDYNGNRYLLYNGNGYGKSGFGIAIMEK